MINKIFKIVVLILMIIGIGIGISITVKKTVPEKNKKDRDEKIFSMMQTKSAEATKFYVYGRAFNINGKIDNINEDNFEGAKLVITDGYDYEREYPLNYKFEDTNFIFSSDTEINSGIIIDELDVSEYFIFLRLKLNNSKDPKYYSFSNGTSYGNSEYFTMTNEGINKKAKIEFSEISRAKNKYNILKISLEQSDLPENIYDIVIDAGHGGTDRGENAGNDTEADITLEYAKQTKQRLEELGYKVLLTRDDNNSNLYTDTNMYDKDGRISIACESKAKLMISYHINQGVSGINGLEIYCPPKSNLDFAKQMANNIKQYSNIQYSNNNSFKMADGVYVRNFTNSVIKEFVNTANKKGYEPYSITKDTAYLYTIRETGGIATGAYVDGRNTIYAKNEYYDSNYGIECYQIELGYIKNDLQIIKDEKVNYIRGIVEAIEVHFKNNSKDEGKEV